MPTPAADANALPTTALDAEHARALLARMIYERVDECVDHTGIDSLEQSLAIELARQPAVSDDEALALARGLIRRAVHQVGDSRDEPGVDEDAAYFRYIDSICREPAGPSSKGTV